MLEQFASVIAMTLNLFFARSVSISTTLSSSIQRCFTGCGVGLAILLAAPLPLMAQPSPSPEAIAEACRSGRVTTLPLPFPDLQRDHWAFESVMRLYYGCVAYENQPNSTSSVPAAVEIDGSPDRTTAASSDRVQ